MKKMVEERGLTADITVDSAGIGGWHIGQLPDQRMRRCGAAHGYCFDSRARQISREDFPRFDAIVVMDNENYRAVTSLATSEEEKKKVVRCADFLNSHRNYTTIPDPYYGGEEDFELVITLLEDALEGLLRWINTSL